MDGGWLPNYWATAFKNKSMDITNQSELLNVNSYLSNKVFFIL